MSDIGGAAGLGMPHCADDSGSGVLAVAWSAASATKLIVVHSNAPVTVGRLPAIVVPRPHSSLQGLGQEGEKTSAAFNDASQAWAIMDNVI